MATVRWHLDELTGSTLTLRLYPLTSGSIANGAGGDAMVEGGDGLFESTVAESLTGWHKAYADRSGAPVATGFVNMSDASPVVNEAVIDVDLTDLEDAIDAIPSPLMVSLLYGEQVPRAFSFTGELYLGEIAPNTIRVMERNTTTGALSEKDLSGIASLSLTIADYAGTTVQQIANASLDRSDDANGNIGWTNNSDVTASERKLRAFVWNDAGPVLLMEGSLTIKYAKRGA